MTSTKANIIYNFAGRIIPAILSILITPFYLHYLSVEYFGIIGFFASIQTFLTLLDGGISPTLNREVARLSAFPEKVREMRNFARTLETICWLLAITAAIIALLASPFAAKYWLNSENISVTVITQSFILMSFNFAFQWASNFYTGGLIGLQRQKLLNTINILLAFPRSIGSLLVLKYVSPTITALLVWQFIITILNCVLVLICFWKSLPKDDSKPRFDKTLLRGVWRYAAGMFGTSIVVLILTQTDKLILSKMLTLEQFGYYSLAQTLAGMGIGMIVSSVAAPYFPLFSQLVVQNKIEELKEIYHRASQVMSFFLIPTVCIITFFSYQILLVWTRNAEVAENTYILLSLVALGTGLNGLMHIPYNMQLANGITRIGFWQNVIAVIILIPIMIYGVTNYGAIGGASAWVILNAGYIIFSMPIMHKMILKEELRKWYLRDVGLPIIVSVFFCGVFYYLSIGFLTNSSSIIENISIVFGVTLILFFICGFTTPVFRNFEFRKFLRI